MVEKKVIRAKAPLRLGIAGGGTDTSPYSDEFGGMVLNATITMYAYATLIPRHDGRIRLISDDYNECIEISAREFLNLDGKLDLAKGVYNRIVNNFVKKSLSFDLVTYVDVPAGSGLGSSSTLVAAMIGAFTEWLDLPLGEYDIAKLAYEVERKDLGMAGGKQDQYAATFGGFNFMEFLKGDNVIVNPLRIKQDYINELEFNLLLYHTGTSRLSSKIIESQSKNVAAKKEKSIEAMNNLKEQACLMKEAILKGDLDGVGEILDFGWQSKKQLANEISNSVIDEIYDAAKKAGASGGKISGAGGGGFMLFYCPGTSRYSVIEAIKGFGGEFRRYQFTKYGLTTWSIRE